LISSYKETLVADGKNAFYWNEEILTNNGVQRYKSIIILIKKIINRNFKLFKNVIKLTNTNEIVIRIYDSENFHDVIDLLPESN